ncbi:hypothetical protein ACNKU7_18645 [Microbulbifer sp. SA54]|uniref:hypothetical protein n=1 Tax=Microbulbifer sp. SA54 TaxID=3401577 RepID=UPI003AB083D4
MDLFNAVDSTFVFVVMGHLTVSSLLCWLVRSEKTARWLSFCVGSLLILTSAIFLGMLHGVEAIVDRNIADPGMSSIKIDIEVAVLILPFVSAAIGSSLIAHVITSRHKFEGTESVGDISDAIAQRFQDELREQLSKLPGVLPPK